MHRGGAKLRAEGIDLLAEFDKLSTFRACALLDASLRFVESGDASEPHKLRTHLGVLVVKLEG